METVRIYRLTGLRPRYRTQLRAAQMEAVQVLSRPIPITNSIGTRW